MEDQELLQMMVVESWERYRRADRREKLALLRHSFSMYIPHADRGYEFLRIVLDDRAELEYSVNKAAAVSDDYTLRGFVRFVFALGEGETKLFTWVTAHGNREWILSRDSAVLYVDVPEFGEGFFIRYGVFRDECFAAYEKVYAWGYKSDIQRIEVPERDLESLTWLEPEEEFETSVDIQVTAYIPSTYIEEENQKLDIYKRISSIRNETEAEDMLDELLDRFGEPPAEVRSLIDVALLREEAHHVFITEIRQTGDEIRFTFLKDAKLDGTVIPEMVSDPAYGGRLSFHPGEAPYFLYIREKQPARPVRAGRAAGPRGMRRPMPGLKTAGTKTAAGAKTAAGPAAAAVRQPKRKSVLQETKALVQDMQRMLPR